jgi:SAM-dependent methyltransferase
MAHGDAYAADIPPSAEPLSALEQAAAVTREAVGILGRLVRHGRVRRTGSRVAEEYDGGYWADLLARRPWQSSDSLSDFLIPHDRGRRIARVGGRLARITNEDYYRYRVAMLRRILVENAGTASSLAEVGCGYGVNLFSLVELNHWRPLIGFDISKSALDAAAQIAKHFRCESSVEFHRLDLTDPQDAAYARLRGQTVFSYYCFEQLKRATREVIGHLIAARVARVIHIEATPELWQPWIPSDAVNRLYTWSQDYQNNLLTTLRDEAKRGRLRLTRVERLRYAPSVRHDPTVVCWEPVSP